MSEPEKTENAPEPRSPKIAKIDAVRQFVEMMKANDLTALDFIDGSTQIRLRRGSRVVGGPGVAPQPTYQPPVPPQPSTAPPPVPPPVVSPPPATPPGVVIESPMVGTFYSSSSPDSPPLVAVGATVRSDTTVCIIEAMKVFTDIPAGSAVPSGQSGTITEILVQNGQSVEFGQPLFRVKIG